MAFEINVYCKNTENEIECFVSENLESFEYIVLKSCLVKSHIALGAMAK